MNEVTKEFLAQIISVYKNDICSGCNDKINYSEIRQVIADLIVILTNIYLNYSFCDNQECMCNAQVELRQFVKLNDEVLNRELYHNQYQHLLKII